jgi:hypothetical protein
MLFRHTQDLIATERRAAGQDHAFPGAEACPIIAKLPLGVKLNVKTHARKPAALSSKNIRKARFMVTV